LKGVTPAGAETGYDAWLRYAPLPADLKPQHQGLPAVVVTYGKSALLESAREELVRGLPGMLGRTFRIENSLPDEPAIIVTTLAAAENILPTEMERPSLESQGYWLTTFEKGGNRNILVAGADPRGTITAGVSGIARTSTAWA
jgi:alpha-glucuronidase